MRLTPCRRGIQMLRQLAWLSALLATWRLAACQAPAETIGMCWGQVSNQPLPAPIVVNMLQANKVNKVKLFGADPKALAAMAGTGIEIMVTVTNQELANISRDATVAQSWVDTNVQPFIPLGIDIKYVAVGNEPFLQSLHTYDALLFGAVRNIHAALVNDGLDKKVKVTVSFNSEILQGTTPPSNATFVSVWRDQIANITALIANTSSVFSVNIYPFYDLSSTSPAPASLVFFDRPSATTAFADATSGLVYKNLFDATYDSLLWALTKIGYGDLEVIIGEIGWPSDGDAVADLATAREFNQGVVQHLLGGGGTPLRPNRTIQAYLFSLFDEDAKNTKPGAFERKWGVYTYDGVPKYDLDLTGGGNTNAALAPTEGVQYLPAKWCVAAPGAASGAAAANLTLGFQAVCNGSDASDYGSIADCTPVTSSMTSPGLGCAVPGTLQYNASFAFNAYYQEKGQNDSLCEGAWGPGAAVVVKKDPSYGNCMYPRGLDLKKMAAFGGESVKFSFKVLGYIVALVFILTNFL